MTQRRQLGQLVRLDSYGGGVAARTVVDVDELHARRQIFRDLPGGGQIVRRSPMRERPRHGQPCQHVLQRQAELAHRNASVRNRHGHGTEAVDQLYYELYRRRTPPARTHRRARGHGHRCIIDLAALHDPGRHALGEIGHGDLVEAARRRRHLLDSAEIHVLERELILQGAPGLLFRLSQHHRPLQHLAEPIRGHSDVHWGLLGPPSRRIAHPIRRARGGSRRRESNHPHRR